MEQPEQKQKKPYQPPELKIYGAMASLTQGTNPGPGTDMSGKFTFLEWYQWSQSKKKMS